MSYESVTARAAEAAERTSRSLDDIVVVAVSKAQSAADILAVYERGHRDFGENRAQELAAKAPKLPGDIRWHFVGALQSNKARVVRPVAHLLHSMDRPSLGAAWLKGEGAAPPALLQVNLGRERGKAGADPEDVEATLDRLADSGVDIVGLTAIPPIPDNAEASRPHFRRLREVRDRLAAGRPALAELSMGMSDDFETAIEEGATIIRVGRAIFGPRD